MLQLDRSPGLQSQDFAMMLVPPSYHGLEHSHRVYNLEFRKAAPALFPAVIFAFDAARSVFHS